MRSNLRKASSLFILSLCVILFASCRATPKTSPTPTPAVTVTPSVTPAATPNETATASPAATPTETADTKTTASIVNSADAFEKAISKEGTWIIALLNDLTLNKDIVLDGEFRNSRGETQRKIALYEQDENKKVTARYTLTAPKLTINSPNARIQSGTFKGDVYVNAEKFQLVDATVEGNVYFASDAVKTSFTMDATSKVTGKQEVKK